MTPSNLTAYELLSIDGAGEAAGAYLESLGKTDLATLSATEWTTFLKTVLVSYGDQMRDRLLSHSAPF